MISSTETILEKAQHAFFRAMLKGYASTDKVVQSPLGMPGTKTISLNIGEFFVVDSWDTYLDGQQSGGIIKISCEINGTPYVVWEMHYGGKYPKEVIPFLKQVLFSTYTKKEFCAGRGSGPMKKGNLLYINTIERNDFKDFKAREEIHYGDGTRAGYYEVFGFSLLPK